MASRGSRRLLPGPPRRRRSSRPTAPATLLAGRSTRRAPRHRPRPSGDRRLARRPRAFARRPRLARAAAAALGRAGDVAQRRLGIERRGGGVACAEFFCDERAELSDPSEPLIDMRREPSGGVDWEPRRREQRRVLEGRLRSGGRAAGGASVFARLGGVSGRRGAAGSRRASPLATTRWKRSASAPAGSGRHVLGHDDGRQALQDLEPRL